MKRHAEIGERGSAVLRRFLFLLLVPALAFGGTPDIVLKDFDGRDRHVGEYIGKGKWTVVAIWAHDCHICNAEIHRLTFFHEEHRAKDAIVLGVSIDGMEGRDEAREFVVRHRLNFPNLIAEPEHEVLLLFGGGLFIGTPTFYVYTPKGEIAGRRIGPITPEELERFIASQSGRTASGSRAPTP